MAVIPKVDPEFESLMHRHTKQEEQQLKENLVSDKVCREPIVVWKATGLILDGHKRFAVCMDHGIEYEIVEIDLPDREAAKHWIYKNQLGRRNMSKPTAIKLANFSKDLKEKLAKERMSRGGSKGNSQQGMPKTTNPNESSQQGMPKTTNPTEDTISVRDQIAGEAGVSHGTLQRYNEILKDGSPELIAEVDAENISIAAGQRMLTKEFLKDLKKLDHCIKYAAECLPFSNSAECTGNAIEKLTALSEKIKELKTYVYSLSLSPYI